MIKRAQLCSAHRAPVSAASVSDRLGPEALGGSGQQEAKEEGCEPEPTRGHRCSRRCGPGSRRPRAVVMVGSGRRGLRSKSGSGRAPVVEVATVGRADGRARWWWACPAASVAWMTSPVVVGVPGVASEEWPSGAGREGHRRGRRDDRQRGRDHRHGRRHRGQRRGRDRRAGNVVGGIVVGGSVVGGIVVGVDRRSAGSVVAEVAGSVVGMTGSVVGITSSVVGPAGRVVGPAGAVVGPPGNVVGPTGSVVGPTGTVVGGTVVGGVVDRAGGRDNGAGSCGRQRGHGDRGEGGRGHRRGRRRGRRRGGPVRWWSWSWPLGVGAVQSGDGVRGRASRRRCWPAGGPR